jgi:hypothetical protein
MQDWFNEEEMFIYFIFFIFSRLLIFLFLKNNPSTDDPFQSVGIVLCCSLSYSVDNSKIVFKLLNSHFPTLESHISDDRVQEVVGVMASRLMNDALWKNTRKKMSKLLVSCLNNSPFLPWFAILKMIESFCVPISAAEAFWKLAYKTFSASSGKHKTDKVLVSKTFGPFVNGMNEEIADVGVNGSFLLCQKRANYIAAYYALWNHVKMESIHNSLWDSIFLNFMLTCHVCDKSSGRATSLMAIPPMIFKSIMSFPSMADRFFMFLKQIQSGDSYPNSEWLAAERISPHELLWSFLTFGIDQIPNPTLLKPYVKEITNLIFDSMPFYWDGNDGNDLAYPTLLEIICKNLFKISIDSSQSTTGGDDGFKTISSICQTHLYNPHPLVHNIALDLWCIIIKTSSITVTKSIPEHLGMLLQHVIKNYSSIDLSTLHGLNHIRLRTKSILFRVLSSLPEYFRPNIDTSLENIPLFQVLNCNHVELGDGDLFLLDILPLSLMSWNARYSFILNQIMGMLPKQSLKIEANVRLVLCLRAACHLIQQCHDKLSIDSLSATQRTINNMLTTLKNMTSMKDFAELGDVLALIFDIIISIKEHVEIQWRMIIINFSDQIGLLSSVAKVAFAQFLSKCIEKATVDQFHDVEMAMKKSFNQLIEDSDWLVSSESILAYFSFRNRFNLDLKLEKDVARLNNEEEALYPSINTNPQTIREILLSSVSCPNNAQSVMDALISFKIAMLRFAEQQSAQRQNPSLIQELTRTNARLAQLESTIVNNNPNVL